MTTVNQFVNGFNQGDLKSAAAACAGQMSIIDEFSPHFWQGSGAFLKWIDDFDADAKKNDMTDGFVTLSTPRHIEVTGDRAYVVAPAIYAFKQEGKAMKETGSIITIALQKIRPDGGSRHGRGRRINGVARAQERLTDIDFVNFSSTGQ